MVDSSNENKVHGNESAFGMGMAGNPNVPLTTITTGGSGAAQLIARQVENANRRITDYHLLRVIGTGTFGKVYLALLDGQPVALKALKKT